MAARKTAVVVLAAGRGTRMKSDLPKVLHPLAGRPMISHLLGRVAALESVARVVVVTAPGADAVRGAVAPADIAVQTEPLGTGHAVLAAREALAGFTGDILVLCGDSPLMRSETLDALIAARRGPGAPAIVVLGMRPEDPGEYGRLLVDSEGALEAIVEYREATPEIRAGRLCNSGMMAADCAQLFSLLGRLGNDNAKGEYYLTDVVALARAEGAAAAVVEADADELRGINSRADLAAAEAIMQNRLRAEAMAAGASLIDPSTVYFSADTRLGRDVTVGPQVFFGPGVTVGDSVEIRAFCHIEGAAIAAGAIVGPFARLRPGADIGAGAHIGNFVEIKKSLVETGAKVNHLAYIGDSRIGAKANVGAGTITCNYDGFVKSRTDIGAGAFIGSNTALVAPVTIGDGAMVGAGSVVTEDVEADALAVGRGRQRNFSGWAVAFRSRQTTKKATQTGAGAKPGRRETRKVSS